MSEPSEIVRGMILAAVTAGEGLKRDMAAIGKLNVQHKLGLADPFSEADLRAEESVRNALLKLRPDYGFLGEEGGLQPGRDTSHVWIVDPLDGTKNFLIGMPIWAVNIALARDGEVIAGVTHIPPMQETFWAETGGGAWLNEHPIRVSPRSQMIDAVLGVGIPFAGKARHGQFLAEMERLTPQVSGIRRLGAGAVDMAYVACGRMDAYWEQAVSAWDIAAGTVIVREAGGVVTDTLGRTLDLMNGTILAATPQIQSALLEALAPID